ncbi:MAG: tetratricopeptide repeat protein [Chloroflexi bacterium]|nr:MAG: tetratricopeptide repeat protein [Chloroflexota bacterium]
MLGLILIAIVGGLAIFYKKPLEDAALELPVKLSEKLDRLWEVAQESLREKKYLRAEKALLTILRVDERNATAYNRLGILYAKQQAYKDAIECFEIAQSLEPSASSLHNVGLIYYETGNYDKAGLAFEQALEMESDLSSRHIAYAKVQEKLGHDKKMIEALEKAVEIDPIPQTLNVLADAYERVGQSSLVNKIGNVYSCARYYCHY